MIRMIAATSAIAALAACTSSGNVERGAVTGAALGGAAGAIIGNNVGSGDARTGAAIGAVVGGAAGAHAGAQQDRANQSQVRTGPNGEPLIYDQGANRYYYVDRRNGWTYWANGDYRG